MKKENPIVKQLKKATSAAALALVASGCAATLESDGLETRPNGTRPMIFRAADREKWKPASNNSRRARIFRRQIKRAEELLKEPIPQPTASLFMEFVRNGNRVNYENVYFARRRNLVSLVIAECAEYKGRFLDRIVDYLWEITAEHTWCLPAHVPAKYNDGLPDLPYEIVDLFTAETGMNLALTLRLLEPELKKVSPNLVREVRRQLIRHVIEPVEIEPFPFWWLKGSNNWRPWCSSNVLAVAQTVLDDQPERQKKIISMLKNAIDDFVKIYAEDGCCDEGPGYWGASPVATLYFYEMLGVPMNSPKHARMAEYILHVRMGGGFLANFADGHARQDPPGAQCYRFGELLGNEELKQVGLYSGQQDGVIPSRPVALISALANIFWLPEYRNVPPPKLGDECHYYDYRQMLFLKDRGMALGVKRGFYGSHYHLDVGQFIIFRNGSPVIVDPGIGVYSKETFGEHRYENWIINSNGHNPAQFNGVGQLIHPERDERSVELTRDARHCVMKMDLTSAYPPEAGLSRYQRTVTYDYARQTVEVEDRWELKKNANTVTFLLYSPGPVRKRKNGLSVASMNMDIDGCGHEIELEKLPMTDPRLRYDWGESLTRIKITAKSGKKGAFTMRFTPRTEKK
ncbi:MAG: heparinase II/III family protein [Lentisphaeria bacterium]|nr:heparinase II/III family protein [Lentisphaeria bacterium]